MGKHEPKGDLTGDGVGAGPMEAIEEFLRTNDMYVVDESKEKFLMTFNPRGYLRRVK